MTLKLIFPAGLAVLTLTALSSVAFGQATPLAGAAMPQSSPPAFAHPRGALRTPADVLAKVPEVPKYRDFLPVAVDLSDYFPFIGDQVSQGSCVAWASGFAARAYYAEVVEHRDISKPENVPSPAFIYNAVHQAAPSADDPCGGGSDPVDALNLLVHGVMSLADYPYDGRNDATACPTLSKAQIDKGTDFKIAGFEQMKTFDDIKAQLAQGNPVIIAADLDAGFDGLHGPLGAGVWQSGPIDPKAKWEGHAFTLIGYDDQLQTFKFINSWSPEWGDNGFGRMSYQTAYNRISAAFVIKMPGDPDITLKDADFRPDVLNNFGPTQQSEPNVGAATRAAATEVPGLWCGKVSVSTGADGKKVATGYVGTQKSLDDVKAKLGDGVDTAGVELAAWPLCETRLTLGGVLGGDAAPAATVAAADGGGHTLTLAAPADASYLYAVTFEADGTVRQVASLPNASGQLSAKADKDAQSLIVLSSQKPLLADVGSGETVRDFLSRLRDGLLHADAGKVTAALVSSLAQ